MPDGGRQILQKSVAPRGLSRAQAAAYIGVGVTKFGEMVLDGRMPRAKRIDRREVWDIRKLDDAFEALPDESESNPWDVRCGFVSKTVQAK